MQDNTSQSDVTDTVAYDNSLPLTSSNIPADRISELYNGKIFTKETSNIAKDRIHWMCSQCVGKTVLDVGCSQGITSILLAREGFTVTGLDSHPDAISYAQKDALLESKEVQSRLTWLHSDLNKLSSDKLFDNVILGEVIEHQALPQRFLKIAASLLKPDGRLILTTPFGLKPHPDHKSTIMPLTLSNMTTGIDLNLTFMDTVDGYIRAILQRKENNKSKVISTEQLLSLTGNGCLSSQKSLHSYLDFKNDTIKKKTELAKKYEKQLKDLKKQPFPKY